MKFKLQLKGFPEQLNSNFKGNQRFGKSNKTKTSENPSGDKNIKRLRAERQMIKKSMKICLIEEIYNA